MKRIFLLLFLIPTLLYSQQRANIVPRILADDGNRTHPAYAFIDDINTGVIRLGADSLGLVVGDSVVVRIGLSGLYWSGKTGSDLNFYNVEYWGVIPDNATEQISLIQIAVDSVASLGGGTLYFPPGTYKVGGAGVGIDGKILLKSNVHIVGAGTATKFYMDKQFAYTTGSLKVFYGDGLENVSISNVEISSGAVNNGYYGEHDHAIEIRNSKNVSIYNCYIHDMSGDGMYLANVDYVLVQNNIINIRSISPSGPQVGRNCVAVVEGDNIVISNNVLTWGLPAAIDIEPNPGLFASNITISGNTIDSSRVGIYLHGGFGGVANCNVIGNTLQYCHDAISLLDLTGFSATNNVIGNSTGLGMNLREDVSKGMISGNTIYGSVAGEGITIYEGKVYNLIISGNFIFDNYRDGIKIYGTAGSENRNIILKNNVCWNNVTGGEGTYSGIRVLYTDSLVMSGNFCYDTRTTAKQNFGFRISDSDDIFVTDDNYTYGNIESYNITKSTFISLPMFSNTLDSTQKVFHTIPGTSPGYGYVWRNSNLDTVMSISGAGYFQLFGKGETSARNLLMSLNADTADGAENIEIYLNTPRLTYYVRDSGFPRIEAGAFKVASGFAAVPDTGVGTIWRDASKLYVMGRNKANAADSIHVLHNLIPD